MLIHLFDSGTTYMGFRRGHLFEKSPFEFAKYVCTSINLTKDIVAKACATKSKKEPDKVFDSLQNS